ncbi:MAG: hypothetical protein KUL86_09480 [Castellaniella sp.]|nr:hypothetical protein [Castellaniella sp.]
MTSSALAPPPEEVVLGDEKRLEVETYTRYRITDPLRFYQSVRTEQQARIQLTQLVSTSLRRELGKVKIQELLSSERGKIASLIQQEVVQHAPPLGLQATEVRLHRADLPLATSQAIYNRMKSARQQEASQLRAQGNDVMANAFGSDPGFYKFDRSLQTYREALANSAITLVLSPDAAVRHDFEHGPATPKP